MTRVYLALGSNLSDPLHQINTAFTAIDAIPCTIRITTSSLYRTKPYGQLNQPDYINAVVELETTLQPKVLLEHIQRIELEHGRVRQLERWGSRTLDLDIMLFGKKVINTSYLKIPHYDMHNRPFMLIPLLEIAPHLILPNGWTLSNLLTKLDYNSIQSILKSII